MSIDFKDPMDFFYLTNTVICGVFHLLTLQCLLMIFYCRFTRKKNVQHSSLLYESNSSAGLTMVLSCLYLWDSLPGASHGNSAQLWSTVSCINGRVWNKQREDRQVPNLLHRQMNIL